MSETTSTDACAPPQPAKKGGVWTAAFRQWIYDRDYGVCAYCGKGCDEAAPDRRDRPQIDHIRPVTAGGGDEPDNLTVACQRCNVSKGSRTPEEWREDQALTAAGKPVKTGRRKKPRSEKPCGPMMHHEAYKHIIALANAGDLSRDEFDICEHMVMHMGADGCFSPRSLDHIAAELDLPPRFVKAAVMRLYFRGVLDMGVHPVWPTAGLVFVGAWFSDDFDASKYLW